VLAVPMLDGRLLERLWGKLVRVPAPEFAPPGRAVRYVMAGLAVMVGLMSIPVVENLALRDQVMNASYNPLQLVNTYGMFGSVTSARDEVVVEGTDAAQPGPDAAWREYEFKAKPGDVMRRPPQIAPYHLRLDWLMWFAALGRYQENPWFVNLAAKLLQGDGAVLGLIARNPFPRHPPRYVRALLYRYRFSTPEERRRTGAWWQRELEGEWFPVVSLDTPGFREALVEQGWMAK
jgi:Lipase maturation factor